MQLKRYLTIITLSFYAFFIQAQTGKFFSADKQLSSSFVTQVYLDKEGFIWATTRDGINRYDGYQFRVFRRGNGIDKTLASNYVNTMLQDRDGLFYFGMYGALQTWDGMKFYDVTMTDLKGHTGHCYANCFLERKNGDVLAGTSGLGVMKFTDKTHAQQIGGALADLHTVNSMMEDHLGRIWMVTDSKGLICYDGTKIKQYLSERSDLILFGLCEDQSGNIFLGTSNAGLFRLQGDEFTHVAQTGNNPISALACDHFGNIVIGYDGKGVAAYSPREDYLLDNPFFSLEVDLSKSKVYSIIEDNSGNMWLGLLQKGLYMQPIQSPVFQYMGYKMGSRNLIGSACIISTLIDSKGRTWIGTDKDGLYLFDSSNRLQKHFSTGIPSTVMAIAEDPNGRIWIGSYREGYGYIDAASLQYREQPYPDDDHLIVMDIVCDSQQRLWLGTMKHGVLCKNLVDGSIKRYAMDPKAETDRQVNSITNNYVSQLSISPDEKRLYVSTSMGLCCLDIKSDSWVKTFGTNCPNYSVPVRVAREYNGHIWSCTNDGLYLMDLKGKVLKHYTSDQGLADNGVSTIEQDKNGKLWIGTNHGLSCLDQSTGLFRNYYADDGLQSNEFSDGASCSSADGTLLFGGTGGITWFKPQDIVLRKWEANVQLTSFAINGQPVSRGSHSGNYLVTDTTVFASKRFELSYNDNSFSIEFSTLTYENPEHISYLYSVNGEPFIRLQKGVNLLTFSHLPNGTYRFRVKAEKNNTETPERSFIVVVHSPW